MAHHLVDPPSIDQMRPIVFKLRTRMLTGRETELTQGRSAAARGRGIVIMGAPGVGKTALATTITDSLDSGRFSVVRITATDASRQVPFGALAGLLTEADRGLEPALVLSAIRRGLTQRSGRTVCVFVVDDAHLLDGPSAAVVLGLVNGRHARVVATVRAGAPVPDAITSLWKDHGLVRLHLEPLGPDASGGLVSGLLDGPVARSTVELMHQWSGGNPLFLTELTRAGHADSRLVLDGGLWWWRGPLDVPSTLQDMLERRVSGLDPEERDALGAVALGEPLPVAVFDLVAGPKLAARLEDAVLVRTELNGARLSVRFDHPLLGAAVRRGLSPARRRRVAAKLLAAVDRMPHGCIDTVTSAILQLEAAGPVDRVALLRAAESIVYADPHTSVRLARRVYDEIGGVAAATVLTHALVAAGDVAAARSVLMTARHLADAADGWQLDLASALLTAWAERAPTQARAELARLRDQLPPGTATDEVDSVDALVLLCSAHTAAALDIADRLIESSRSPRAQGRALLVQAVGRTLVGRTADAYVAAQEAVSAPQSSLDGLPYARGMALAAAALANLWRIRLSAVPVTDPAVGRWPTDLPPEVLGAEPTAWPLFDGYVRRVVGDRDGAISRLREALVQQSGGEGFFRSEAAAWLTLSLAEAGDLPGASNVLETQPPDSVAIVPGLLPWARAGLASARGRIGEAIELMDDAVALAHDAGCWLVELGYLTYSCELMLPVGERRTRTIEQIMATIERVDAPRLVATADAVLAELDPAHHDLLGHATRLRSYGLRQGALRLAESVSDAAAAPAAERSEAALLASALRDELGLAVSDQLSQLTSREAEVAALAAGGMSDREIADHLVLSVRTVETHLSRVYRKLAISSRRELARADVRR